VIASRVISIALLLSVSAAGVGGAGGASQPEARVSQPEPRASQPGASPSVEPLDPSQPLAGTGPRVALGVAVWDGRDLARVDAFSDSIGGITPAIWAIWSQWGSPERREFPSAVAEGLAARGVTPMIWWEPVDPADLADSTYPRHRNISRGDHDAYIRRFARAAKAFGGTVLLRLAHEANGSFFPWSVERFDNSPRTFIRAWRHVHRLFAEEGATNVRFVWSVAKQRCPGGCNPYRGVYPGDAFVDVAGLSNHNWGAMKDNWVPLIDGVEGVAGHLAEITDRPLMIAELGSDGEGGDKAAWIREGYRAVYERLPAITAIVYLDVDLREIGHPDWSLGGSPAVLEAYAEVAALGAFSGRAPFDTPGTIMLSAPEAAVVP
jgi:mannan endo-1,4-beta-mannosidase